MGGVAVILAHCVVTWMDVITKSSGELRLFTRSVLYFPHGCNENVKDTDIAVNLSRAVIEVLGDVPPSVSPRDAPLASVLTSRELKPAHEHKRYAAQRRGLHIGMRVCMSHTLGR